MHIISKLRIRHFLLHELNNQVVLTFQTKEVSKSVSVEKMIMCDLMGIPYIKTKLTSVEGIELLFVRG